METRLKNKHQCSDQRTTVQRNRKTSWLNQAKSTPTKRTTLTSTLAPCLLETPAHITSLQQQTQPLRRVGFRTNSSATPQRRETTPVAPILTGTKISPRAQQCHHLTESWGRGLNTPVTTETDSNLALNDPLEEMKETLWQHHQGGKDTDERRHLPPVDSRLSHRVFHPSTPTLRGIPAPTSGKTKPDRI